MISTIDDGTGSAPLPPQKVVPWLRIEGETWTHYPEFFLVQPKAFSGKKLITLCHRVSDKYGETTLSLDKCVQCKEILLKRGHHEPKTVHA